MLSKFLDPKNDFAFKKIFGSEKNKDILIHFLNDMILFKGGATIVDVSFLPTVLDPETAAKKASMVDVLCKDTEGHRYIVEMQVAREKGFEKRAQYYAAKAYTGQARQGDKYHDLKEIIFLAISDFVIFPEKEDYKSDHIILDRKTYENDLRDFSFTFLELPKFNKRVSDLENIVDKWLYFFKRANKTSEENLKSIVGEDAIIERAYEELNQLSWSEAELNTYEQEEKYERDRVACLEQKFDEGERANQWRVAHNMVKQGFAIQNIATIVDLSEEEVEKLLAETPKLKAF